jgi:hypothetical protein
MSGSRMIVPALGAAAIVALFLVPPFFGVDRASGGRVHAAIGHHPVWRPPTSEQVFVALAPPGTLLPAPARLADFQARINRVRLTGEAFAVALAVALGQTMLRRRRS